ncbi:MAG: hypothetical protein J7L14_02375, partial [Candidatus Diapherotrites archaeon]|nr:hypothetical protein [Candidatus Diapherotrites archaeon]
WQYNVQLKYGGHPYIIHMASDPSGDTMRRLASVSLVCLALLGLASTAVSAAPPELMPNKVDANLVWQVYLSYDSGHPNQYLPVIILLYEPLTSWQRSLLVEDHDAVIVKEYEVAPAALVWLKASEVAEVEGYYWIRKMRLDVIVYYEDSAPVTLSDLLTKVEDLSARVASLEDDLEECQESLSTACNTIEDLNETIAQLQANLTELTDDYNDLLAERDELLQQLGALNATAGSCSAQLANCTADLSACQDEVADLNGVIADLQDRIGELNQTVQTLQDTVNEKDSEIETLQAELGRKDRWSTIFEVIAGVLAVATGTTGAYAVRLRRRVVG